MNGKEWTFEDCEALRRLYPFAPWSEIHGTFPDRQNNNISAKARKLGIHRHREANSKRNLTIDPLFIALRRERESRGMTRVALSKKLGYHHVQIARWEIGDDQPPWRAIRLWAEALKVEIGFVGGKIAIRSPAQSEALGLENPDGLHRISFDPKPSEPVDGIATTYSELIWLLIQRRKELGYSQVRFDDLMGWCEGQTGKYEIPHSQVGRRAPWRTLTDWMGALGIGLRAEIRSTAPLKLAA